MKRFSFYRGLGDWWAGREPLVSLELASAGQARKQALELGAYVVASGKSAHVWTGSRWDKA